MEKSPDPRAVATSGQLVEILRASERGRRERARVVSRNCLVNLWRFGRSNSDENSERQRGKNATYPRTISPTVTALVGVAANKTRKRGTVRSRRFDPPRSCSATRSTASRRVNATKEPFFTAWRGRRRVLPSSLRVQRGQILKFSTHDSEKRDKHAPRARTTATRAAEIIFPELMTRREDVLEWEEEWGRGVEPSPVMCGCRVAMRRCVWRRRRRLWRQALERSSKLPSDLHGSSVAPFERKADSASPPRLAAESRQRRRARLPILLALPRRQARVTAGERASERAR